MLQAFSVWISYHRERIFRPRAQQNFQVEDSVHEEFVERLVDRASQRVLGNPFDNETTQGPQVDQEQFDKIMRYIERGKAEGAECRTGGDRHGEQGYFVQPTVFTGVSDEMDIASSRRLMTMTKKALSWVWTTIIMEHGSPIWDTSWWY